VYEEEYGYKNNMIIVANVNRMPLHDTKQHHYWVWVTSSKT